MEGILEGGRERSLAKQDLLDKAIVIAIVVTALLGAIVGLGQIRALKRHDEAVSSADQWAALSAQVGFATNNLAQLQLDRFYLVQDARVRQEQADADAFLGVGPRGNAAAAPQPWGQMASLIQRDSLILANGTPGNALSGTAGEFNEIERVTQPSVPDATAAGLAKRRPRCSGTTPQWPLGGAPRPVPSVGSESMPADPLFPTRYLTDTRREVFLLAARGTLASEHAEAEEKQFTRFGLSLTLFATAVFMFGFALSPYGRIHRHLYATVAAAFVVGSLGYAVFAAVKVPANGNPAAAAAFADGEVAFNRGTDPADVNQAIAYFSCALGLDPDFAPAHTYRAMAYNSVLSPADPTGGSNTELLPSKDQSQALIDLRHAAATDPVLPFIKGTDIFQAGVDAKHGMDRGKLLQGLQQEQEAARLLTGTSNETPLIQPVSALSHLPASVRTKIAAAKLLITSTEIAFNIAEADLALGWSRKAAAEYHTAVMLAGAQMKTSGLSAQGFASGALTDLADIAAHSTGAIKQEALAKRSYVVANLFHESGPKTGYSVKLSGLEVFPAVVGFTMQVTGWKNINQFNAQWYYRPRPKAPWSAFSAGVSGEPQYVDPAGFITTPYVPTTTCLPSGQYRLELYVNGRHATDAKLTVTFPKQMPLSPVTFHDIDVTVCAPVSGKQAWQPLPEGRAAPFLPTSKAGLIDGFTSPDHMSGLLVFDVTPEADQERGGNGTARLLAHVLHQFAQWLPPPIGPPHPVVFPFLGGANGVQAEVYPELFGSVGVGMGPTPAGRMIAAVAYGPTKFFNAMASNLIGSIATSDPGL